MYKVAFVGNIYAGDDGIAQRLFEELKHKIDADVFNLENGVNLASYVEDKDTLIIVDAIIGEPGTVEVFKPEEFDESGKITVHDVGVGETIALLTKLRDVRVHIIGVGVKDVSQSESLSPEVLSKWPEIKYQTLRLINKMVK